jgi:hypothetical protein
MNLQTHFHFFKREAAHGGYPPTMWGFSGFLAAEGRNECREPLRRRHENYHRVAFPKIIALKSAKTSPQVDDAPAGNIRGAGGPDLLAIPKILLEHFQDKLKPRGRESTDRNPAPLS